MIAVIYALQIAVVTSWLAVIALSLKGLWHLLTGKAGFRDYFRGVMALLGIGIVSGNARLWIWPHSLEHMGHVEGQVLAAVFVLFLFSGLALIALHFRSNDIVAG